MEDNIGMALDVIIEPDPAEQEMLDEGLQRTVTIKLVEAAHRFAKDNNNKESKDGLRVAFNDLIKLYLDRFTNKETAFLYLQAYIHNVDLYRMMRSTDYLYDSDSLTGVIKRRMLKNTKGKS